MKKIAMSLVLGMIGLNAFAEVPVVDNSNSYRQYNSTEGREARLSNGSVQLLLSKLDTMQQEIAFLRGQIEIQSHEIGKLKLPVVQQASSKVNQSDAFKAVINEPQPPLIGRRSEVKPGIQDHVLSENKSEQVSTEVKSLSVDEQLSYLAAFELVKNKQYDKASPAMEKFIKAYPSGPYTANAHYWHGELMLLKQDYPSALNEFSTVVSEFSNSNKLAAAKLKIGMTYEKMGQKDKAVDEYTQVADEFPNTSAAVLAKVKLNDLS